MVFEIWNLPYISPVVLCTFHINKLGLNINFFSINTTPMGTVSTHNVKGVDFHTQSIDSKYNKQDADENRCKLVSPFLKNNLN